MPAGSKRPAGGGLWNQQQSRCSVEGVGGGVGLYIGPFLGSTTVLKAAFFDVLVVVLMISSVSFEALETHLSRFRVILWHDFFGIF